MVFGIVIAPDARWRSVFFHYVQGFFSATISAVIAIISAVVARRVLRVARRGPARRHVAGLDARR